MTNEKLRQLLEDARRVVVKHGPTPIADRVGILDPAWVLDRIDAALAESEIKKNADHRCTFPLDMERPLESFCGQQAVGKLNEQNRCGEHARDRRSVDEWRPFKVKSEAPVALPEVEWWAPSQQQAQLGRVYLRVWCASPHEWHWTVWVAPQVESGKCATEAEAKSAAIAAARGLR